MVVLGRDTRNPSDEIAALEADGLGSEVTRRAWYATVSPGRTLEIVVEALLLSDRPQILRRDPSLPQPASRPRFPIGLVDE